MLRLLIDQDLDHVILRGLLLRAPNVDVVPAHQAGLSDTPDPGLLAWAAEQRRIVVTHDRSTMPYHAATRIARGESLADVIIVPRRLPVGQVIHELEIVVRAAMQMNGKMSSSICHSSARGPKLAKNF
jgi:predicted nuclease of predicted toxin-antitoxin system